MYWRNRLKNSNYCVFLKNFTLYFGKTIKKNYIIL